MTTRLAAGLAPALTVLALTTLVHPAHAQLQTKANQLSTAGHKAGEDWGNSSGPTIPRPITCPSKWTVYYGHRATLVSMDDPSVTAETAAAQTRMKHEAFQQAQFYATKVPSFTCPPSCQLSITSSPTSEATAEADMEEADVAVSASAGRKIDRDMMISSLWSVSAACSAKVVPPPPPPPPPPPTGPSGLGGTPKGGLVSGGATGLTEGPPVTPPPAPPPPPPPASGIVDLGETVSGPNQPPYYCSVWDAYSGYRTLQVSAHGKNADTEVKGALNTLEQYLISTAGSYSKRMPPFRCPSDCTEKTPVALPNSPANAPIYVTTTTDAKTGLITYKGFWHVVGECAKSVVPPPLPPPPPPTGTSTVGGKPSGGLLAGGATTGLTNGPVIPPEGPPKPTPPPVTPPPPAAPPLTLDAGTVTGPTIPAKISCGVGWDLYDGKQSISVSSRDANAGARMAQAEGRLADALVASAKTYSSRVPKFSCPQTCTNYVYSPDPASSAAAKSSFIATNTDPKSGVVTYAGRWNVTGECIKTVPAGTDSLVLPGGGGGATTGTTPSTTPVKTTLLTPSTPTTGLTVPTVGGIKPLTPTAPPPVKALTPSYTSDKPSYTSPTAAKPGYTLTEPAKPTLTVPAVKPTGLTLPTKPAPSTGPLTCPKGQKSVVIAGKSTCVAATVVVK